MKIVEQNISGVFLIEPEPFRDKRGLFRRHFCQREFKDKGIFTDVKQTNISENGSKHTLRGFHFQHWPQSEAKILSCLRGVFYDIVLDLRPKSGTYLKWVAFELTEENRVNLHVPAGCANAYLTLTDDTWIFYYHSEFYQPTAEGGIRYNDTYLKFEWPSEPLVISEKDMNYSDFDPRKFDPIFWK